MTLSILDEKQMLDTGWTCYSSKVNDPAGQEELSKINLLPKTIKNLQKTI